MNVYRVIKLLWAYTIIGIVWWNYSAAWHILYCCRWNVYVVSVSQCIVECGWYWNERNFKKGPEWKFYYSAEKYFSLRTNFMWKSSRELFFRSIITSEWSLSKIIFHSGIPWKFSKISQVWRMLGTSFSNIRPCFIAHTFIAGICLETQIWGIKSVQLIQTKNTRSNDTEIPTFCNS